MAAIASKRKFSKSAGVKLGSIGQVGEEVAIVGELLPALGLAEMLSQAGEALPIGDAVQSNVVVESCDDPGKGRGEGGAIEAEDLAEAGVVAWILEVELN